MEKLADIRIKIDELDRQMVDLFSRRMDLSVDVAKAKAGGNLPLTHPERERQVIDAALAHCSPEHRPETKQFMRSVIELSKGRQIRWSDSAKNVVFIGMPGCGKTTVSRLAAQRLQRQWYDSDQAVEHAEDRSIPEIFAHDGEQHFREVERRELERLLAESHQIVAVGGGAVICNEQLIKSRAVVVYLRRPLDDIRSTMHSGTRPLVTSAADLSALYEQRHAIYERAADITIDNNGTVEQAVDAAVAAIAAYERVGNDEDSDN